MKKNIKPHIKGPGNFAIDVVGESHYQDNLETICGGRSGKSQDLRVRATLVPEKDNPYDKHAVRVDIDGKPIGHLRRDAAREYRRELASAGFKNTPATCGANVRGGWKRGKDKGHFGVWLDLPIQGNYEPWLEANPAESHEPGFLKRRVKLAIFTLPLYLWALVGCCGLSSLCLLISEFSQ
jgi:hypothetical protein